jgi:ATP-dependent DNA helicase DinG
VPEVPAVPGSAGLTPAPALAERVERAFAPGGPLARALPGFEAREGQREMAAAVAAVLEQGGGLLAEAGTGTGKTLAYLVPAILSRQRVLVSTGTKNLQEQIFFKDVPALRETLGVPFNAAYMKGRGNYLCLHRLDQLADGPGPASHDVFLPIIREWAARTATGDRSEIDDLPEDLPFWNEVSATADACIGTECPRYEECFVTRMRQQAAAADVVIVNHHLLCADAAVRQSAYGEVIPACGHLVIDEAHQLEDVATQYFGTQVSTYRFEDLARDIEHGAPALAPDPRDRDEVARAVDRLRDHARAFFAELAAAHRSGSGREERVRATPSSLEAAAEPAAGLTGALDFAEATLALLAGRSAGAGTEAASGAAETLAALVRRTGELRADLRLLMRASDPELVYFVELRGRGVFLRASPIDVSRIVRGQLLDRFRSIVLTSATLAVDDSYTYIRERLGIGEAAELRLPSEFDFARQAVVYLPPRMPDPRSPQFAVAAGREVVDLVTRTRGRAFVLFTSYSMLRAVQAMAEMALDFPILAQGAAPRSQLLRQFRETPHAVLFATSSFWQGVDVVGDALSCVIIDKLPFASPADPITAARIEAIRERGGDPFGDYQVPLAILALQQGLGRLIRHRRDRGVLAVLDPRLRTKGYGRRFMASLPPAPIVHSPERISAFFADSGR